MKVTHTDPHPRGIVAAGCGVPNAIRLPFRLELIEPNAEHCSSPHRDFGRILLAYPESMNACLGVSVVCALVIPSWAQGLGGPIPQFEDYPAPSVFQGKVAPPQLVTAEERQHAGVLGKAAIRMPNFAGNYVVMEWFCGELCARVAIIDARAGTIHPSPFKTADSAFALPLARTDFQRPEYRLNSKLLVVRNACPEGFPKCATYYFVWENNTFRQVQRVPVKVPDEVAPPIPRRSPLSGEWEGTWSYANGTNDPTHRFQFTFEDRSGRLTGTYIDLDDKQKRQVQVEKLAPTSADKSTYRMEIEGDCWNVRIEGDSMSGMWNGGECSVIGIGPGARLIGLEAKRVATTVR
jgi:hypothetical protein